MDRLDLQRIRTHLGNSSFIREIRHFEETDSTNTQALKYALAGAYDGTVILAEGQRSGRGRQGRTWVSPPGRNLYLSLILRPSGWRGHLGLLAFVGGLAVVDVLRQAYGLSTALKWPNDVLLDVRKLAGILVETARDARGELAAVLGIGVNINMEAAAFPEALSGRATSMAMHLGCPSDRSVFAGRLLESLGSRYCRHRAEGPRSVVDEWKFRSVTLGRRVVIHSPGGRFTGEAVDITENGFLVLRTEDGRNRVVMAGDVDLL